MCLGISTLAKVATPELSRDLLTEVSSMLSSSRSLVRKKAVLALYRLLLHCPEASLGRASPPLPSPPHHPLSVIPLYV